MQSCLLDGHKDGHKRHNAIPVIPVIFYNVTIMSYSLSTSSLNLSNPILSIYLPNLSLVSEFL